MTITKFTFGDMTAYISDSGDGGLGGLNLESVQFLADNPEALETIMKNPVMKEVLQDQATFDFWREMCEKKEFAVDDRIPAKHFSPKNLAYYMQRQVNRITSGRNERNLSRHGHYHVAGKSLVCPVPELIKLCSNNAIIVKPCYVDAKSLKYIRRTLRNATLDHFDRMWKQFGLPLKKTSTVLCGKIHTSEGKQFVSYVPDDIARCTLMLYFGKIYGNMNVVKPGVKNALSLKDEQTVCGLSKRLSAKPMLSPKLSKADLKMMSRKKKKKHRKVKPQPPSKKSNRKKQQEMNRKFELLSLKRKMGLEKTVV